ncbi:MAG: hypothetical protein KF876_10520 [Nitrospira sp.]|nr:hypothetical protein [Nitrospira sp.]
MGVKFKDPETFVRSIGVSAKGVATVKSIAAWAAAASTVYGIVAVAVDVITKVLGGEDPVQEALDDLRREAMNIRDKILAGQLTAKLDSAASVHGVMLNRAAVLRDFVAQRSEQNRKTLVDGMHQLKDHVVGRAQFDANRLPFDPLAYQMLSGEPPPSWMAGHGSWHLYTGFHLGTYLAQNQSGPLPPEEQSAGSDSMFFKSPGLVQVLRPVVAGASLFDRPPDNLVLNALRWDGRFNFPLLLFGTLVYENVLRAVEPYYRTTGDFRQQFGEVINALGQFADAWDQQLLWTSDMPAAHPPQNEAMNLLFGFEQWPCGAVDPVFGTASFQEGWWEAEFPPDWGGGVHSVGLMSAAQSAAHASARSAALSWVRSHSGLLQLRAMTTALRALLTPPWSSESLTSFHDRSTQTVESILQSMPATATTFNILTPATTYQGTHETHHIRVRVPIAIQGNPGLEGIPNLPRYAVSDVTFGYRIELVGENHQRVRLFDMPLRRRVGEQGVWHTNAIGAGALRSIPWSSNAQAVSYNTRTYLRYVDPSGKLHRQDDFASGTVALTCRVVVSDAAHDPIPGLSHEWPPRGVLWLEIESASPSNRSFELRYEITETTAVGADGSPTSNDALLVRYRTFGNIMVDALVGVFPAEYHAQYEHERKVFFDWMENINEQYKRARQRFGPPRPDDKFDQFQNILDLVADPFWAPAVLEQFARVRRHTEATLAHEALKHGIGQLRQQLSSIVAAPRPAFQLPPEDIEGHR